MITKSDALKLVQVFGNAAIRSYRAANEVVRDKHAFEKEFKAAKKLLQNLTSEPISDEEINGILGG